MQKITKLLRHGLVMVTGDERGFTLIELLVVVIIIGILAAIAIPTFIAQRDRAAETAVRSDLRNGGTAALACASDNMPSGSFAGCDDDTLTTDYGWNKTDDVVSEVQIANQTQWVAEGYHVDDSDQTVITFDTNSSFQ